MGINVRTDYITLILIALILVAFAIGAYRINNQAADINRLIEAQSPLIFSFESAPGSPNTMTFIVTCEKIPSAKFYVCKTEQKK